MINEEVYVYGKQECSKAESRRPPPYDAGAAHEALPDFVHEALGSHATGRRVIVERTHDNIMLFILVNTKLVEKS